ncbi:MAG: hypothetical protein KAI24_15160 [Planctomycetes bacterium]|nr:hypothetical protein [Planctomycetota bacterium]
MKTLRTLVLPALLAFAACGSGEPKNPMAGNWSEVVADGKPGMTLSFDGYSDKLDVHMRPREDGSHGHEHGTYSFDEKTGALTVNSKLIDGDKAATWTGKVEGDGFELSAANTKLKFTKGGKPHGH